RLARAGYRRGGPGTGPPCAPLWTIDRRPGDDKDRNTEATSALPTALAPRRRAARAVLHGAGTAPAERQRRCRVTVHVEFTDRRTAGRALAAALEEYGGSGGPTVVLGLTHGGVPVAAEVAAALQLPRDVLVVHKIATPAHPALGLATVVEPGHVVV